MWHCISAVFNKMGVDHWSTHTSIRDLRKAFQTAALLAYPRGSVLSRINLNRRRTLSLPHLSTLLPLDAVAVVGFLDTRTLSNSAKFRPLLLSMRIKAPESTKKTILPLVSLTMALVW